ncbi:hypothetical protein ABTN41_20075, partial [Acinetobacter baumannii]
MIESSYDPTGSTTLETLVGMKEGIEPNHEVTDRSQGMLNQNNAAICSATLSVNRPANLTPHRRP